MQHDHLEIIPTSGALDAALYGVDLQSAIGSATAHCQAGAV